MRPSHLGEQPLKCYGALFKCDMGRKSDNIRDQGLAAGDSPAGDRLGAPSKSDARLEVTHNRHRIATQEVSAYFH
jgi:hypothetical protein